MKTDFEQERVSAANRTRPGTLTPSGTGNGSTGMGRKPWLIGLMILGVFLLITAAVMLSGGVGASPKSLVYYTANNGDLLINVTERGNLQSQQNIDIMCMVDDIDGDSIYGTPIVYIVPNGSAVTNNQLIVELDPSGHQERLDRQILLTQKAKADHIKAKALFDNQITQNATALAAGQLKVKLAELSLKQYEDEEGGTFQISLQDAELLIREAEAAQLIEKTNLEGVEQLYQLGYRSSGELAQAQLQSLKTKRGLTTALAKKRELVAYTYEMQKLTLEGDLETAKRNLIQIERDNEALLQQAQAAAESAEKSLKKEEERLKRYEKQIQLTRIYAPAAGMVAYSAERHWRSGEIREGAAVRPRQRILTIPNLAEMQVETAVHESVLHQVKPDLPVTVRVDAFPERSYQGSVKSVAVLPDQGNHMASDTKVYRTIVTINEEVAQLKPGMTAVVEIHIDHLKDVLSIPVQAIVQRKDQNWIYVETNGDLERRDIELGLTNDKFVEIKHGLAPGERVVLNPMSLADQSENAPTADDGPDAPPEDATGEGAPASGEAPANS